MAFGIALMVAGLVMIGVASLGRRHRCTWSKWSDFTTNIAPVVQIRRCSECGKAETRTS